jgi:hypothetical protein
VGTFVGREAERAHLVATLDEAARGRGGLVVLCGEPGIGKTTLAAQAARAAADRGFVCLAARSWEGVGAPAYWPVIQVLRQLLRDEEGSAPVGLQGDPRRRSILSRILPELLPDGGPGVDVERLELFEAAASCLREAATIKPLFLLLDDLHAVDGSSLAMVRFLAHELRSARVAVVVTYREHFLGTSDEVLDGLARLEREGTSIRLARLAREDVARLVEGAGRPVPGPIVDLIFQTSEGVPLFVEEIMRALGSRDGAWRTGAPIPAGVRAVIRDRLAGLDEETRAELERASVVGVTFTLAVLGVISEGSPKEVHARVERAVDGALVERVAVGRYAFAHGLIREALYREIPGGRRAALHATIFEALANGRVEAPVAAHAHHAMKGAPVLGVARAIATAMRAAAAASAVRAFEDAHDILSRALAITDVAPTESRLRDALAAALQEARSRLGTVDAADPPRPSRAAPQRLEMTAEGDVWLVRFGDDAVRVKDSRGIQMLSQLVGRPGEEVHALTLGTPGGVELRSGDAGDVLDRQAIVAYRERIQDAEEELREAEAWSDAGRSERCRAELELLRGELSRAVGLGGRARRAGSDAERARINAQRRLREAIERIAALHADAGRHLRKSVRTGTFCSYAPVILK